MKQIFASFHLNETSRRIFTYVIYFIFAAYTLTKLIQEPSAAGKTCYALILLVILGIALWAEYLRILYYRMVKAQSMTCDPNLARHYYKQIQKRDFVKSYRHTLLIFDTLYYQDIDQPKECIRLVETFDRIFRSSLDLLLIRYYTFFYSYYQLGNRTKVKKYYPLIKELRGKKIKGSKVSPLYNWEYIDAIYLFVDKDYKKAVQAFKNVNTANMNNRELSQFYIDFGKAYMEINDKENASIMFSNTIQCANKLSYAKKAEHYLHKL